MNLTAVTRLWQNFQYCPLSTTRLPTFSLYLIYSMYNTYSFRMVFICCWCCWLRLLLPLLIALLLSFLFLLISRNIYWAHRRNTKCCKFVRERNVRQNGKFLASTKLKMSMPTHNASKYSRYFYAHKWMGNGKGDTTLSVFFAFHIHFR